MNEMENYNEMRKAAEAYVQMPDGETVRGHDAVVLIARLREREK